MSQIYNILATLANTSSRNEKIAILKSNANNVLLKRVCYMALNPYLQFYIRKIPSYRPTSSKPLTDNVLDELLLLSNRVISGNAAIIHLTKILESLSLEDSHVISLVISKDLKCGVADSTVNKVWNNLIPTYPCLLGHAYDEKTISNILYPACAQVKADGMRINVHRNNGVVSIVGRSGKPVDLLDVNYDILNKIFDTFDYDVVLDGELEVVDDNNKILPREKGNGILNKGIKGTISQSECERVRYTLWDVIPKEDFITNVCNIMYKDRFNTLVEHLKIVNTSGIVKIVETCDVSCFYDANKYFEQCVSNGLEGIMLKNWNSIWEDSRSKNLVKFKSENECDLVIVGFNNGNVGGKWENGLGSLLCESSDGIVKVSISGFSDNMRNELYSNFESYNRKIVTVRYNTVIKDDLGSESLFLPRFVEVREDKTVADARQQIK